MAPNSNASTTVLANLAKTDPEVLQSIQREDQPPA